MILTALPPFVRGSGSWSKNNEFPKPNYIINLYFRMGNMFYLSFWCTEQGKSGLVRYSYFFLFCKFFVEMLTKSKQFY